MEQQKIEAQQITKPIQLLAAWLVGLILINGSFLSSAILINNPEWGAALLVIAAVINVPLFLLCIFLLQTKFRPEMQEDSFYSKYLEMTKTRKESSYDINSLRSNMFEVNKGTLEVMEQVQEQLDNITNDIKILFEKINPINGAKNTLSSIEQKSEHMKGVLESVKKGVNWSRYLIAINDLLPNYIIIRDRLSISGILISSTFGLSSKPSKPPKYFILTFGKDVAAENVQDIIRLILDCDLNAIQYTEDVLYKNTILIGSYGYEIENFAPIDDKFINDLMASHLNQEAFVEFIRKHSTCKPLSDK